MNNIPALVQIMAWRRPGDKTLSEPMMVSLPTHLCVTRPQWVKMGLVFGWPLLGLLSSYRADSRFAPSQWEAALLCNDISHRLAASIESAVYMYPDMWSGLCNSFEEQALANATFGYSEFKWVAVACLDLHVRHQESSPGNGHQSNVAFWNHDLSEKCSL